MNAGKTLFAAAFVLCLLFAVAVDLRAQAPLTKLSPDGEAPQPGDLFRPYLQGKAPAIVKELDSVEKDGVILRHLVFRSLKIGDGFQDVYAAVARPSAPGPKPGILWVHGGAGCVDDKLAVRYAKEGYVVVAPELPGIAEPKKCPNSTGPWRSVPYGSNRFLAKPDASASNLFDAFVAGLQAFDLLASQPDVRKDRLGISGSSWGGFTTTKLCGLLGDRVKAAYSTYGCGFYDRGTVFKTSLDKLPEDEQETWYREIDSGRQAGRIKADFFIAAAVCDHYFWPPAVDATRLAIQPGKAHGIFAPLKTHSLAGVEGSESLDIRYFAFHLKGEGQPFPDASVKAISSLPDGGRKVEASVSLARPAKTAVLHVSDGKGDWEKRTWAPIEAKKSGDGSYEAIVPPEMSGPDAVCFFTVTDDGLNSASSLVFPLAGADGSAPSPIR